MYFASVSLCAIALACCKFDEIAIGGLEHLLGAAHLAFELSLELLDLPLQALHVRMLEDRYVGHCGRARTRQGVGGRRFVDADFVALHFCARGRARARLVAAGRALRLRDQRDVPLNRYRGDQIFFAGERLDLPAFEIAARTVFLNSSDRTRKARPA